MNTPAKPDKTGEVTLDLLGRRWPARLTFRAIRNLERELDLSVLKLAERISTRDIRYEDVAAVFHHAIVGGGASLKDAPDVDEVGEALMAERIEHWIADYSNMVVGVITAGQAKRVELAKDKPPGEAAPQTTTTSGEPTGQARSATSGSTQPAPGT